MSTLHSTFDRFRKPEYTGKNRCLPCTIVNVAIAVVLAAGIAILWLPGGSIALVGSLAVIYLRGYLVPGTPELTQQYFPGWLLQLFGKEPVDEELRAAGRPGGERPDPDETERLLDSAGVVENCEGEDDLCLTPEFGEIWWQRIRQLRADEKRAADRLAAAIEVDPEAIEFVEDDQFGVTFEGDLIARWESDAAFYADLAAESTLAEWLPEWDELGDRHRTELLAGMRAFLEECPSCDADLEPVENVRKSCCAGEMVSVSVDCASCGARVFSGSYA